jgi:hypothetical protein
MAIRATRRVTHDYHPSSKKAVANHACFSIALPRIFDLQRETGKDERGVSEVEPTFGQGLLALGLIERDSHKVIVSTTTTRRKSPSLIRLPAVSLR